MTLNPFQNSELHSLRLKDTVVIRGQIISDAGPVATRRQIVFDDHVPNRALRLIKGYIWQDSEDGANQQLAIACSISTVDGLIARFDASDYNQIGWMTSGRSTAEVGQKDYNDIIDPTNLISHQAFANFWHEGAVDIRINFMFICQRVDLDDTDALIVTLNNYIS